MPTFSDSRGPIGQAALYELLGALLGADAELRRERASSVSLYTAMGYLSEEEGAVIAVAITSLLLRGDEVDEETRSELLEGMQGLAERRLSPLLTFETFLNLVKPDGMSRREIDAYSEVAYEVETWRDVM